MYGKLVVFSSTSTRDKRSDTRYGLVVPSPAGQMLVPIGSGPKGIFHDSNSLYIIADPRVPKLSQLQWGFMCPWDKSFETAYLGKYDLNSRWFYKALQNYHDYPSAPTGLSPYRS